MQPYAVDYLAASTFDDFTPQSVIHLGVGTGKLIEFLRANLGLHTVIRGMESSLRHRTEAWTKYNEVIIGDFTLHHFSGYDLVLIDSGVMEELEGFAANNFMRRITAHNGKVLLVLGGDM